MPRNTGDHTICGRLGREYAQDMGVVAILFCFLILGIFFIFPFAAVDKGLEREAAEIYFWRDKFACQNGRFCGWF